MKNSTVVLLAVILTALGSAVVLAATGDMVMPETLDEILVSLMKGGADMWIAVAAIVNVFIQVLKTDKIDTFLKLSEFPERKARLAVTLGLASGILIGMANSWGIGKMLLEGIICGMLAMGIHEARTKIGFFTGLYAMFTKLKGK